MIRGSARDAVSLLHHRWTRTKAASPPKPRGPRTTYCRSSSWDADRDFWLSIAAKDRALHARRLFAADARSQPEPLGEVQRPDGFYSGGFQKERLDSDGSRRLRSRRLTAGVHELRHASRIPKLYAQLYSLLVAGGTILIWDHVNSSSPPAVGRPIS
jgi:hypothetical protein